MALYPDGRDDFYGLRSADGCQGAALVAFDVLAFNGKDLRRKPLYKRRAVLQKLLAKAPPCIAMSDAIAERAAGVRARLPAPDVPFITNLRLDPFERTGWPGNGTKDGAQQYFDWFKFQFWRFVFVQQVVGKQLQTFLDYPPMQRGASFNLDAVKAEMRSEWRRLREQARAPAIR